MHFPVMGVLWFAVCPWKSFTSLKSFLWIVLWLFLCSTHFQSSLDKVPTCCSFERFHRLPGLCPKQVLLTPNSITRPVQAVHGRWEGALVHCQDCTFLGAKNGSRANGRQEREQAQVGSRVILLHMCLCTVFVYSWVFMYPEPALPRVWVWRCYKATAAPVPCHAWRHSLMALGCEWGRVPSTAIIGKLCVVLQE